MPMISLQISQKMQDELDQIQEKLGYASRSEILRESIKYFIQKNNREEPTEGVKIATINVHFEAKRLDIMDEFTEVNQKYDNLLKTINQYNLRNHVIKNIIVVGPATEIHEYFQTLSSNRHFSCTISYLIIPEKVSE